MSYDISYGRACVGGITRVSAQARRVFGLLYIKRLSDGPTPRKSVLYAIPGLSAHIRNRNIPNTGQYIFSLVENTLNVHRPYVSQHKAHNNSSKTATSAKKSEGHFMLHPLLQKLRRASHCQVY